MKIRTLAFAVSLIAAGSAQAVPVLVAGWDFSQYNPGDLTVDGNSLVNTLSANYSSLDTTLAPGIGIGSTVYGTMHLDGQFGSYNTPLDGSDSFFPDGSNIDQNANQGVITFGSAGAGNILLTENPSGPQSQELFNTIRMAGRNKPGGGLLDVVFQADLGATHLGSAWEIAFAGQTAGGGSDVIVEFSTDGSVYNQIGIASLTASAAAFSFVGGGTDLGGAFVRLRLTGSDTIFPAIDNFTLKAEVTLIPEPGTALLMMAGLAGLAAKGRRRA
jgi:hypothetical protein